MFDYLGKKIRVNSGFKELIFSWGCLFGSFMSLSAQEIYSISTIDSVHAIDYKCHHVSLKNSAIPLGLIALGATQLRAHGTSSLNKYIQNFVWNNGSHHTTVVDNYLQYVPGIAAYGLEAIGIKGVHSIKEKSMLLIMSQIITSVSVISLKKITHQLRPDYSGYTSFPSGHTAVAFACATFLQKEYGARSPWYGIAGYSIAAATGFIRIYNNKHWFSDVIAGAGIGIMATKIAYAITPKIFKKGHNGFVHSVNYFPSYTNGIFTMNFSIAIN